MGENDLMDLDNCKYYQDVLKYASNENNQVIPVSAQIESDLSELSEEERKEYLAELNVKESGLEKVIKATYKLLNLSTFFTVGADECRAWTFKNNMSAPECAGVIHTDFQKGFSKKVSFVRKSIHTKPFMNSEANTLLKMRERLEQKEKVTIQRMATLCSSVLM